MYEVLVMQANGLNKIVSKFDDPKKAKKEAQKLQEKGINAEVWHGFFKVVFDEETKEKQI